MWLPSRITIIHLLSSELIPLEIGVHGLHLALASGLHCDEGHSKRILLHKPPASTPPPFPDQAGSRMQHGS